MPPVKIRAPKPQINFGIVSNCSKLRIRKGPSTEDEILCVVPEKSKLEIVKDNGEWLAVKSPKLKVEGFVMSKFVEVSK